MTTSSKWLIGMGGALAALAVIAVVAAVLVGGGQPTSYPEDTPEGVIQRYIQAILDEDPTRAYDYLSTELQEKCSLANWQEQTRYSYYRYDEFQILLKEVRRPSDMEAEVIVSVSRFQEPGSFDFTPSDYSYDQRYYLRQQDDGTWRIYVLPSPGYRCPNEEPAEKIVPPTQ